LKAEKKNEPLGRPKTSFSTSTEVRSIPFLRPRSAARPVGRSAIVDTSLLDGSRAGLVAAQPAWMLCGSACISGSLIDALWLGINLSATPPFPFTMAVVTFTGGGPLLIAICLWIALRAFGRHPSAGSRVAILAVYALATAFFACCAVVQIVVLEPLRGALPASRALSFNAIAIGLAALPSIALAFASAGLLRADLAHLARYGYRVGDPGPEKTLG
jgi:hypothetical protein